MNMRLPTIRYGIFDDAKMLGEYWRCDCGCENITLDAVNLQGFYHRLRCLMHELHHYLFNWLPYPLDAHMDRILDIVDGGRPELLYDVKCHKYRTLYVWDN